MVAFWLHPKGPDALVTGSLRLRNKEMARRNILLKDARRVSDGTVRGAKTLRCSISGALNLGQLCFCTTFEKVQYPWKLKKNMKRIHFHALHIPRFFNKFLEKPTNHRFSVDHSISTEENVNAASSRCIPHISTHPLAPRGIPASRRRREVVPCPFI